MKLEGPPYGIWQNLFFDDPESRSNGLKRKGGIPVKYQEEILNSKDGLTMELIKREVVGSTQLEFFKQFLPNFAQKAPNAYIL